MMTSDMAPNVFIVDLFGKKVDHLVPLLFLPDTLHISCSRHLGGLSDLSGHDCEKLHTDINGEVSILCDVRFALNK